MTNDETTTRARFLAAYDERLRADAETPSAIEVTRLGPLRLVTFLGGRGFVTYRDLGGAEEDDVARLVQVRWNISGRTPTSTRSNGRRAVTTTPQVFTKPCCRAASFRMTRNRS
jgi:hypothetical protein